MDPFSSVGPPWSRDMLKGCPLGGPTAFPAALSHAHRVAVGVLCSQPQLGYPLSVGPGAPSMRSPRGRHCPVRGSCGASCTVCPQCHPLAGHHGRPPLSPRKPFLGLHGGDPDTLTARGSEPAGPGARGVNACVCVRVCVHTHVPWCECWSSALRILGYSWTPGGRAGGCLGAESSHRSGAEDSG